MGVSACECLGASQANCPPELVTGFEVLCARVTAAVLLVCAGGNVTLTSVWREPSSGPVDGCVLSRCVCPPVLEGGGALRGLPYKRPAPTHEGSILRT